MNIKADDPLLCIAKPCAPGMGINYRVKIPNRQVVNCTVSKWQVLYREVPHEGSQTAKSCTDEQESHIEAGVCKG